MVNEHINLVNALSADRLCRIASVFKAGNLFVLNEDARSEKLFRPDKLFHITDYDALVNTLTDPDEICVERRNLASAPWSKPDDVPIGAWVKFGGEAGVLHKIMDAHIQVGGTLTITMGDGSIYTAEYLFNLASYTYNTVEYFPCRKSGNYTYTRI